MSTTNLVTLDDGAKVAVTDVGEGPAILFAHCLGGCRAIWAPLIERLQDRYRCIAYDLRGQGESTATPGPYTMDQLADDALNLLDRLGVERCVFAGISMGGMVAQQLALRRPERVKALILADTAPGFDAAGRASWDERIVQLQREGLAPLVETMMGRWFTDEFRARRSDLVATVAARLEATDLGGYLASCAAIRDFDVRARLHEIAAPTLVLCGENDPSTPLPLSRALAEGIPGARLIVYPGLRHLPVLEAPASVSGDLIEFLQAV